MERGEMTNEGKNEVSFDRKRFIICFLVLQSNLSIAMFSFCVAQDWDNDIAL